MKLILIKLLLVSMVLCPIAALALDDPGPGKTYSYPLPAKIGGVVNVVYPMASSGTSQIQVYNLSSVLVLSFNDIKPAGLQTSTMDLCCLAPGVYLYRIQLNYDSGKTEKLNVGKIVVVR